jgi:hypothetical protein
VIIGVRRCQVQTLAAVCGLSERTVERHLEAARLPPARSLLAWSLIIHAFWRIEMLHWPLKRTALAANLPSTAGLSHLVARHTGGTLNEISARGGFHSVLGRFSSMLHP